jgi:nucleotide-binding universal stress UspA family protein
VGAIRQPVRCINIRQQDVATGRAATYSEAAGGLPFAPSQPPHRRSKEHTMYYKTILVHVDADTSEARIRFSAQLAKDQEAHLVGVTQTGILHFIYQQAAMSVVDLSGLAPLFEELQSNAEQRASTFDAIAAQTGVVSYEHRVGDDDPGNALATQAMYADLAIVGQSDPTGLHKPDGPSIPEYVAMNCPCPVLVLPYAGNHAPVFDRIVVAWNASPESARAVRMALPFLMQASAVTVAMVDRVPVQPSADGGADVGLFLARHGVKVDVQQRYSDDAADSLLSLVSEQAAQLLVMGCYGHSRFREILLGGVSRAMLRCMMVPVLFAH